MLKQLSLKPYPNLDDILIIYLLRYISSFHEAGLVTCIILYIHLTTSDKRTKTRLIKEARVEEKEPG